jgi:SnoaL-like domain
MNITRRETINLLAIAATASAAPFAFIPPAAAQPSASGWSGKPGEPTFNVADRVAIIAVIHAYGNTIDNYDYDKFFALFTPDAVVVDNSPGQGVVELPFERFRKETIARFDGHKSRGSQRRHLMTNMNFLEQTDTKAHALIELILTATEQRKTFVPQGTVQYEGFFEKRDGVWLISRWGINLDADVDVPLPEKK